MVWRDSPLPGTNTESVYVPGSSFLMVKWPPVSVRVDVVKGWVEPKSVTLACASGRIAPSSR